MQGLASVSTSLLCERVNRRLRTKHSLSYISRVKNGHAGSASLRDVVAQEVERIYTEAAQAARGTLESKT